MTNDWLGSQTVDPSGTQVGTLVELFVGRTSGAPEFGVVALEDDSRVAIPLAGARRDAEALVLPFDADRVYGAPRMQAEVDEIPAEVGALIHEHFGIHEAATTTMPPGQEDDGDIEVTLSEEQLAVETRPIPTERVHLRKRVVTEDVTLTVTLRREELVIEREPVGRTSHQAAETDFPLGDDGREIEFVLHAEEPVVTKRVVPVERVRVKRNTITEERHLSDTVRRERVDVDQLPTTQEDLPR